jgi:hypothetical protein
MSRHMCVRSNSEALHYNASGYRIRATMDRPRVKRFNAAVSGDARGGLRMDKWRGRMLRSLEFGTKQKCLNAEQQKLCGRGLDIYDKLPRDLKRNFIECWRRNAKYEDKKYKCNLDWIKDFEDKYYKRSFPDCGLFTRQSCTQLHACACVCMHASHWGHASLKN